MSIELLYIIPLVALSFFALIILLNVQKKNENKEKEEHELIKEVEEFNAGTPSQTISPKDIPGTHLGEIEKTISLVSSMLSNQQSIIEGVQGVNINYTNEVNKLKNRLRELQKEYDIVLSENYSLRARIKKLSERLGEKPPEIAQEFHIHESDSGLPTKTSSENGRCSALLDDTQILQKINLDDTTEINISELRDFHD
ncbi:MAG: hypothetical protein GF401_10305 [Chitinivibrionales bacterium]|nr:hypothetical protein [Chitinivibrionales bacterium]